MSDGSTAMFSADFGAALQEHEEATGGNVFGKPTHNSASILDKYMQGADQISATRSVCRKLS